MKERLKRKIIHLIESKSEGDYWDFKQEWHKDNERLIHDILCFTNTVHDRDCYLIIGVSDKGEVVGVNEEGRLKQAGILDLLSNTVFAGDFTPEVMVDTIEIEDKEIDILIIFNSYTVPYYLKKKSKKYQNLREGFIYTRVGDRNTPIKQNATIHQIEMLWKKRFGLTQAPLVQIVNRLENKTEWIRNEGTYYNIYKPEFRLVEEYDDERGRGQFYVYSQENSSFSYKDLSIMYNQTILKDFQLVVLDSGRFETPVPEWGYVVKERRVGCYKYTYKYYLKNSIEYKLQQFFFDISNEEELYAKNNFDEVILYFDNEEERLEFESYIKNNQNIVD
ncbi:ATP-binding protein [Oceanirhabdus seepicola]|uniref:DNA binding domain-containing protein n=1 Tax=Oceanirhabdus seepicola TaxID=2828781 RepID=A0A9J6P580_9CLOT|nr:ATP-binding protein [Oceanirhabdus seepicola]MCM1991310.1 putative DNA binding domain-containing protein [Oceanirhabdus seepicola]